MYRLGIDVGGTNTDAVIVDDKYNVIASLKRPTSNDISEGIKNAVHEIIEISKVDKNLISKAMLGTTQCTNAIVERKKLIDIAFVRLGAPATLGLAPMIDWPSDLPYFVKEQFIARGGYEYDGKEISPLDEEGLRSFFTSIKGKVSSIAISCVFSPVRYDHEDRCEAIAKEVLGDDIIVSKSYEIGSLSLIERENATILNAALCKVAKSFTDGFVESLQKEGISNAEVYLSQNDGTLMNMETARKYPILTIACGPTNSIRGAAYLSNISDAIVVDVGGTTTDIGVVQLGFPRESSVAAMIGGVRTNFRMPDVISIGLGGGSIVRETENGITIGPDSVGYQISERAKVFGGDVITATDIAVRLGIASIGDPNKVSDISEDFANRAMQSIKEMVEENIDKMKISNQDVDVILVGGGSIIVPDNLIGAKSTIKPDHFDVANAIGSAISKVSGVFEQLVNYEETPREEAISKAKEFATQKAIEAGAKQGTVEIIDVEDVPLAYYAVNTCRLKIKAAGDL